MAIFSFFPFLLLSCAAVSGNRQKGRLFVFRLPFSADRDSGRSMMTFSVKKQVAAILAFMQDRYPAPKSELDWKNPWELLVSTMLAAQCTDKRVNTVTPLLFSRWPDIAAVAQADLEEMESVVRPTGFYRNKARNIIASAGKIMEEYGGQVPASMDDLISLPGVARKTANIVLSNAYGLQEGIAVDTHVKRLSYRLGLTTSRDPVRIEQDLMPLVPRPYWGDFNHYLVLYGREVCKARTPLCLECGLVQLCPAKGVKK